MELAGWRKGSRKASAAAAGRFCNWRIDSCPRAGRPHSTQVVRGQAARGTFFSDGITDFTLILTFPHREGRNFMELHTDELGDPLALTDLGYIDAALGVNANAVPADDAARSRALVAAAPAR